MQFTDIDHSFCEESILGLPEYYNAFSSLTFVFFGIYGMINRKNELFVDMLYANLTLIGIGSFGYHWCGNIGWALFDEIPMITMTFVIIIYIDSIQRFISKSSSTKFSKKNDILLHSLTFKSLLLKMNLKYYHDWRFSINDASKKIKLLFHLFAMTSIIIFNTMSNYRKTFPQTFTFVLVYIFYKVFSLSKNKHLIKNKINNSFITILISGAAWVFTEITCNYVKHSILLLGHPMWHIFVAHGVYNLIQIIYFIKLNHNNSDLVLEYNNFYLLYMKI
jgi:hypothetical protein